MDKLLKYTPDDIQYKIYAKIIYPQPKELIDEIKQVSLYREILRHLNNGYSTKLLPTKEDVQNEMLKIPGLMESYVRLCEENKKLDIIRVKKINDEKLRIRNKFA